MRIRAKEIRIRRKRAEEQLMTKIKSVRNVKAAPATRAPVRSGAARASTTSKPAATVRPARAKPAATVKPAAEKPASS